MGGVWAWLVALSLMASLLARSWLAAGLLEATDASVDKAGSWMDAWLP